MTKVPLIFALLVSVMLVSVAEAKNTRVPMAAEKPIPLTPENIARLLQNREDRIKTYQEVMMHNCALADEGCAVDFRDAVAGRQLEIGALKKVLECQKAKDVHRELGWTLYYAANDRAITSLYNDLLDGFVYRRGIGNGKQEPTLSPNRAKN